MTLYDACKIKTIDLLKSGEFDEIRKNQFSNLSPQIVDYLVEYVFSLTFSDLPSSEDLHFLLKNHRLRRLDLSCFSIYSLFSIPSLPSSMDVIEADQECNSFIELLSKETWPDLRSLILPPFAFMHCPPSKLEAFLMTAPNLEYIHVNDNIDLSMLNNCSKLKNINIHARSDDIDFDELIDILTSLKNIETFEICIDNLATYREIKFFATILKLCPNLISIGNLDSLMVIEYCKKSLSHVGDFKLQKGFWGKKQIQDNDVYEHLGAFPYTVQFPSMIKTAVSCCPSLKVLEMLVYHKDGLQYLNCLYNLTFLCLDFKVCEESYLDTLLSTLNKIGHQLKHLSINDERPRRMPVKFPIDGICDRCVNVESLQIKGLCTFIDSLEDGSGIRRLRRLFIGDIKSKDLLLLLKCCLNLTELRVKNFPYFSNSEVRKYFRIHSCWNLRKLCIFNCNLSSNSLKTLLEASKKLEKVFFPKFLYNISILDELNREVKFVDNLDKFHDAVSGFNSCKFNDFNI